MVILNDKFTARHEVAHLHSHQPLRCSSEDKQEYKETSVGIGHHICGAVWWMSVANIQITIASYNAIYKWTL